MCFPVRKLTYFSTIIALIPTKIPNQLCEICWNSALILLLLIEIKERNFI